MQTEIVVLFFIQKMSYLWLLILHTVLVLLHSVTLTKEVLVESSFLNSLFFLKCHAK